MTTDHSEEKASPRIAVIGVGDIGRGWAALAVSHGWSVTLFDTDARKRTEASSDVERRARTLIALDRADANVVGRGLSALGLGRSLLQAAGEADWVIECGSEELSGKQKLVESLDGIAPEHAVITSSSSGLLPQDIAARARAQHRILVAHPLNPPEIIPLVEVVPSPRTDAAIVEQVEAWLRDLKRVPVTLRKPVPGYVITRIAAAVWREAINLVLDDVIDVSQLDQAVSLGPALAWTAAGPHLTYHLAAGDEPVRIFLQHLAANFQTVWADLADWNQLDAEMMKTIAAAIERSYEANLAQLSQIRDERLGAVLEALESIRRMRSSIHRPAE